MTDGGKQFPQQAGFPTPTDIPLETGCRTFQLPSSAEFFSLLEGALYPLRQEFNWYQTEGGMTPAEAVEIFAQILNDSYEETTCEIVPAPYWDDDTADDADDQMPADTQPWYGTLIDDDLTFVENIGFWVITGFVAFAATPAAAIAFVPIARRFTLAFKKHDLGGIVKAFVDGAEVGKIDTYAPSDGVGQMTVIMPEAAGLMRDDDPPVLWVVMSDEVNPAVDGDPNIQVLRKRLSENEVSPSNIRYNADCDCIQMTPDDGETWNDADGQDPRRAPAFRLPPRTGIDRRCDAAANAVKWLHDFIDQSISILGLGGLAFQIANMALDFVDLLIPGAALIDLLVTIGAEIFTVGSVALDAAFSPDQYDLLLCIFYCAMDLDGQVNADGFASIQSQITVQLNTTAGIITNAILGAQGPVGVSNAGTLGTETADCSGCGCGWCYRFDDTHRLGDWVAHAFGSDIAATYTGTEWFVSGAPPSTSIWLSWTPDTSFVLTDAAILEFTPSISAGDELDIYVNGDGSVFSGTRVWKNGFTEGAPYPITVTRIDVLNLHGFATVERTIAKMQFSGTGENPFGDNNC